MEDNLIENKTRMKPDKQGSKKFGTIFRRRQYSNIEFPILLGLVGGSINNPYKTHNLIWPQKASRAPGDSYTVCLFVINLLYHVISCLLVFYTTFILRIMRWCKDFFCNFINIHTLFGSENHKPPVLKNFDKIKYFWGNA